MVVGLLSEANFFSLLIPASFTVTSYINLFSSGKFTKSRFHWNIKFKIENFGITEFYPDLNFAYATINTCHKLLFSLQPVCVTFDISNFDK